LVVEVFAEVADGRLGVRVRRFSGHPMIRVTSPRRRDVDTRYPIS
jgi:hypothetical protein